MSPNAQKYCYKNVEKPLSTNSMLMTHFELKKWIKFSAS